MFREKAPLRLAAQKAEQTARAISAFALFARVSSWEYKLD